MKGFTFLKVLLCLSFVMFASCEKPLFNTGTNYDNLSIANVRLNISFDNFKAMYPNAYLVEDGNFKELGIKHYMVDSISEDIHRLVVYIYDNAVVSVGASYDINTVDATEFYNLLKLKFGETANYPGGMNGDWGINWWELPPKLTKKNYTVSVLHFSSGAHRGLEFRNKTVFWSLQPDNQDKWDGL